MSNWKKRVLVMEDNLSLALNWKETLELNDCEVVLSHSGDEAAAHLEQESFDLVVTDFVASKQKDGLHVLTKLFAMGRKAPPAIAVTDAAVAAYGHEHVDIVLTQAARLGARASLQKPFNPGELMLLAHDVWAQRDDALLLAA